MHPWEPSPFQIDVRGDGDIVIVGLAGEFDTAEVGALSPASKSRSPRATAPASSTWPTSPSSTRPDSVRSSGPAKH